MDNKIFQVSELKAVYKPKIKASDRYSINSSECTYELLKTKVFDSDTIEYKESVYVLLLNNALKVLGATKVSDGSLNYCVVDIRVVFQAALLANATSIILAHNHPTGNLRPSSQDDTLTENIKSAGDILNIKLLDHIIVTTESYYSYQDEGRL